MARMDQEIGLTNAAEDWIKKSIKNGKIEFVGEHNIPGAFCPHIKMRAWASKEKLGNGNYAIILEVVQAIPWSSGPMYFMHLVMDFGNGLINEMFSWANGYDPFDPETNQSEYNAETGVMYI